MNGVGSLPEFLFELEPEMVYELFHGFELKPAYLPYFTMNYDPVLLDIETNLLEVALFDSKIPNAGLGLFNTSNGNFYQDYTMEYWGKLFLWKIADGSIAHADIDQRVKDRLVRLPYQPFINKGFFLYIAPSLSCCASYCNDINFKSTQRKLKNNCVFEQRRFLGEQGVGLRVAELIAWMKAPFLLYVKTIRVIRNQDEFLLDYYH